MVNKTASQVALFLFSTTSMVMQLWGNFVVYADSYFFYTQGFSHTQIKLLSTAIMSTTVISSTILPFGVNYLYSKLLYSVSVLTSAVFIALIPFVNSLFLLYIVIMGFGISCRFTLNLSNYTSSQLFKNNKSLAIGSNLAGRTFSTIIWSILTTVIINPMNLKTNDFEYFPESLNSNFSKFTFILSGSYVVIAVLGYFLLDEEALKINNKISLPEKVNPFDKEKPREMSIEERYDDDLRKSKSFRLRTVEKHEDTFNIELYSKVKSEKDIPLIQPVFTLNTEESFPNVAFLSEYDFFKRYVLSKTFIFVYTISIARCTFHMTFLNYYKLIVLPNLKDDHFVSFIGSTAFICSLFFQILGGHIFDKFGFKKLSIAINICFMLVLIILFLFPTSKFFYIIMMIILRSSIGCSTVINNSIVYQISEEQVAIRLIKYLYIGFFLCMCFYNLIDFVFESNMSHITVFLFILLIATTAVHWQTGKLNKIH